VQLAEAGYGSQTQEQFDQAYVTWETDKLVIGGKLQAHFRDPALSQEWTTFSDMVSEVYALAGTTSAAYRTQRIEMLRGYFGADAADWDTLLHVELKQAGFAEFQKYYGAWFSLRDAVYRKHGEFLGGLIDAPMAMFQ
jgi:hypothetical protein